MDEILTKCRSCGAYIRMVRTVRGKWMPCEQAGRRFIKDPDGPVKGMTADGKLINGYCAEEGEDYDCIVYIPHWARCPGADAMRRAAERREEPRGPEAKPSREAGPAREKAAAPFTGYEQMNLMDRMDRPWAHPE